MFYRANNIQDALDAADIALWVGAKVEIRPFYDGYIVEASDVNVRHPYEVALPMWARLARRGYNRYFGALCRDTPLP